MPNGPARTRSTRATLVIWLFLALVAVAAYLLIFRPALSGLAPGIPVVPTLQPTPTTAVTPTPPVFQPVRAVSEPGTLKFSGTSIRYQKIVEISAIDYRSRMVLENLGTHEATVALLDFIPKKLAEDAALVRADSELQALERDPIILRYVTLEAGKRLERELRMPAGGQDIHYITLVLEGPLDPLQQPEEYRLLLSGAFALARLDYTKLNTVQVQNVTSRLNALLNDRTHSLRESLASFAQEADKLQRQYQLEVSGPERTPLLLEASELLPLALLRIPHEFLRASGGYAPGDKRVVPLVNLSVSGSLCARPIVCAVRPGASDTTELFVDLRALPLREGRLPNFLEGNLSVFFAERTGSLAVPVRLRVNHATMENRVFAAPRKLDLENATAQRVYVFNNLGVTLTVKGCGIDANLPPGTFANASVRAACELTLGGVRERLEVARRTELEERNASRVSSWRDCADRYCSCEPLEKALYSLVEGSFLRDAGFLLERHPEPFELLRRGPGSTLFGQNYLLRGLELGVQGRECVLPERLATFSPMTFSNESRTAWLVQTSVDLILYAGLNSTSRSNYREYLNVSVREA